MTKTSQLLSLIFPDWIFRCDICHKLVGLNLPISWVSGSTLCWNHTVKFNNLAEKYPNVAQGALVKMLKDNQTKMSRKYMAYSRYLRDG